MSKSDLTYADLYEVFVKEMSQELYQKTVHIVVDWFDSMVYIKQGSPNSVIEAIAAERGIEPRDLEEEIDKGQSELEWSSYSIEGLKEGITIYR